ncbi:MAG: MBL fold metallo-hydrolase [Victivallales bacterium]|nr:MBL fold metallo-hydrolase [Victivallales bacterium]
MSKIGVTVLASGSNGNCAVVHSGSQAIMVDCGISLRTLRRRLKEEAVDESWIKAILITHEHADHIQGARVAAQHFGVPIYATARCAEVLRARFEFGMMNLIAACNDFPLSGFNVRAFPVPHDAVDTVGYVFTRESTKIGLATDLGQTNPMANFQLRDCNTLVLESNYDVNMLASSKRPWPLKTRILGPSGHLSNADSAKFLPEVVTRNTRNVILAHISGDCNTYDIAERTAHESLRGMSRNDVFLTYGRRDAPIPTVWC